MKREKKEKQDKEGEKDKRERRGEDVKKTRIKENKMRWTGREKSHTQMKKK